MENYEVYLEASTAKEILKSLPKIGQGTSRAVYATGDIVVKKAYSLKKGIAQNSTEYEIYKDVSRFMSILCPVYGISECETLLVMAKAKPITKLALFDEDDKELIRNFKRELNEMYEVFLSYHHKWKFHYETKLTDQRRQEIANSELYKDLFSLIMDYTISEGDCFRPSSWGYLDGEFVLIDYGLNMDTYNKFYLKTA